MSTTVNYKGSTIATVTNATKTLSTAGTWVEGDITLVDVTPGKYTATLIADGSSGARFVKFNGTKYFTSGETFSFNDGDSLFIHASDTRGGSGAIYIDDVRVAAAQGYAEYTYTLPESNIEVSFGSNSTSVNSVSAISLQSKTVSYTPSETAQTATVTADSGYDGLGSVDISVGAIPGTYVGSQVPTQAAQTIHPSTSAQTIASGKYLTGDQTIEAVTTVNLTAANIVSGVTVKVGSATDDDCVVSVTGTAEAGGVAAISVVDTTDTAGGTIRTITALDISDTTAVASDVAQGKYFYTADGIKTAGTLSPVITKVAETTFTVNTDSTSAVSVATWETGHTEIWTSQKILYIRVVDTAGKRSDHFWSTDNFYILSAPLVGGTSTAAGSRTINSVNANGYYTAIPASYTTGYGVYPETVYSNGDITIKARYNSSSSRTINGTYKVTVYLIDTIDALFE